MTFLKVERVEVELGLRSGFVFVIASSSRSGGVSFCDRRR